MAYNHVTVDDYYPGPGMAFNDYHVQAVRDIVRAFMDQAAQDVKARVDAGASKVAYLRNPASITNEGAQQVPDWQADNAADDAYDVAHKTFRASPDDYFADLASKLAPPGTLG